MLDKKQINKYYIIKKLCEIAHKVSKNCNKCYQKQSTNPLRIVKNRTAVELISNCKPVTQKYEKECKQYVVVETPGTDM